MEHRNQSLLPANKAVELEIHSNNPVLKDKTLINCVYSINRHAIFIKLPLILILIYSNTIKKHGC